LLVHAGECVSPLFQLGGISTIHRRQRRSGGQVSKRHPFVLVQECGRQHDLRCHGHVEVNCLSGHCYEKVLGSSRVASHQPSHPFGEADFFIASRGLSQRYYIEDGQSFPVFFRINRANGWLEYRHRRTRCHRTLQATWQNVLETVIEDSGLYILWRLGQNARAFQTTGEQPYQGDNRAGARLHLVGTGPVLGPYSANRDLTHTRPSPKRSRSRCWWAVAAASDKRV